MRLPKSGCVAVLGNKSIRIDKIRSVMNISAYYRIFFKGVLCGLSIFSPSWCAIIWCKPHCAVLNYLGPVAPCRSIRDGKIRPNRSELQKAAERQIRRKARKRRKAQKGQIGRIAPIRGRSRRDGGGGQPVVDMAQAAPLFFHSCMNKL